MSIPMSFEGIAAFLKQNDGLITQIRDGIELGETGATDIRKFFTKLNVAKDDAQELLDAFGPTIKFAVAKSSEVRATQEALLEEINEVSQDIRDSEGDPDLRALQLLHRSRLYKRLADTLNDTVSRIIPFDQQEIDELDTLLNRARLDAQQRQKMAFVLDGAVGLAKFAAKVAMKVAAA
jgi:hypothetical protein